MTRITSLQREKLTEPLQQTVSTRRVGGKKGIAAAKTRREQLINKQDLRQDEPRSLDENMPEIRTYF